MFDKFTDRARKVMALANQEAQRFNHEYIGCEHILLGLVKEGSGVAANVLKNLDCDLRKVRLEVEKLIRSGPDMVTMGKLPMTPRVKQVIENANIAAKDLRHVYVGTEHILLGLLKTPDNVGTQVLVNMGLSPEVVYEEIINLLGAGEDPLPPPDPYLVSVDELAERAHRGQTRSNGQPYINHPRSVMNRLKRAGITDPIVLATALCHDIEEDTEITPIEIELFAGPKVREAVRQLTNKVPPGTSFEAKTASMLEHARHYNDIAKRVKLADRYDNLADAVFEWQPDRVRRYAIAGMKLLDAMSPMPEDMKAFEAEARRFFSCLIP
jgi:hypothetical protein